MWRSHLMLKAIFAITGGTVATASVAQTFTWDGDWDVTLEPEGITDGNPLHAFRAFGSTAAHDGDKLGLSDGAAVAKSGVIAAFESGVASSAVTGVQFTRSFTLKDSPEGWNVVLDFNLAGQLLNKCTSTAGACVIPGEAIVRAAAGVTGTSIGLGFNDSFSGGSAAAKPVSKVDTDTATLSDGTYTVRGFLRTQASTLPCCTGEAGITASDFFNTFEASVSATPIPEPSTHALMLAGLGALGWTARRSRRFRS